MIEAKFQVMYIFSKRDRYKCQSTDAEAEAVFVVTLSPYSLFPYMTLRDWTRVRVKTKKTKLCGL
jgi:hypothetical protein